MKTNRARRTVPLLLALAAASLTVAGAPTATAAAPPRCHGHAATIVGTNASEYLAGTPGRDVIVARGGNDRIRAGGGNDLVCAGKGADLLWGGPGNDRLYGQGDRVFADQGGPGIAGDTLRGGPGDDVLDAGFYAKGDTGNFPNTIAYDEARTKVEVLLGGDTWVATGEGRDRIVPTGRLTLVGSAFADRLDASRVQGDVKVVGAAGSDRIRTGAGDDEVFTEGESVDHAVGDTDQVWTNDGSDTVSSYTGSDTLLLGDGPDFALTASGDPVTVQGGNGGDQINAIVHQVDGLVLDGGTGNNTVVLDATDVDHQLTLDRRQGTLTAETLEAVVRRFTSYDLTGGSAWTYRGADLPDLVVALSAGGPIQMFTLGGNDELWGSAFDDLLDGGAGTDEAHPAGGTDTCVSIEVGVCD
ncbi:Hemolysin-type calcium-binding repeat-containing protein [Nocardioides szechwanensis]|uniref:Hemolysin-type calcium-binding repeat-containing protein n=2 Tax=Nocardioides szechwanensis TaxID=1005944 RepID=A0A1H0KXW0_9ACTN|nr:Hemolysin-type calcium-binding repeat-containing protein [Nocardioides szechwanensis]